MKIKTMISILFFSVIFMLFSSMCFAMDDVIDMTESVKNTVGGAENVVEDAADGVTSGVKNGVEGIKNTASNMGGAVMNVTEMASDNYTAERTASTNYQNEGTFLGLNSTTWTWIIMGIVGLAVVGLIIYYNSQRDYRINRNNHNDY